MELSDHQKVHQLLQNEHANETTSFVSFFTGKKLTNSPL